MVAVTIIMPVYNAEKYLKQSIESILKQTFSDWELILVDDNSTDSSNMIIRGYCELDNRVRMVKNEGGKGAGAARNFGMRFVRGEYVLFLDADDFFSEELVGRIFCQCKENSLDICLYNYATWDEESKKIANIVRVNSAWYERLDNKIFSVEELGDVVFTLWTCAPWLRMIRRGMIIENDIRFQEIHNANDLYFSYATIAIAKRIKYVEYDEPLLFYRTNLKKQLSNSRNKAPYCIYQALKKVYDLYLDKYSQYMCKNYYIDVVQHVMNSITSIGESERKELVDFYQKEGLKNLGLVDILNKELIPKEYKNYIECVLEPENEVWVKEQGKDIEKMFDNEKKNLELSICMKENNYKCVLWGCGKLGKLFLREARQYDVPIINIVDKDERKRGTEIEGYVVEGIERCNEDVDVVFVTNIKWVEEIKETLVVLGSKAKVLDLYSYYRYGVSLRKIME